MKLLNLSKLYKKKKKSDTKDTQAKDPNTSNTNTTLIKEDSNDLQKRETTESSRSFLDYDRNNVNTQSFVNTSKKNKHSSTSMKSYSMHQNSSSVLDSDISDSDDAKQESNKCQYNRKSIRPIINNKCLPQQHRQYRGENPLYRTNPDTALTTVSNNSSKVSVNDPVIARMQDRHRNQVKMAALRKQQLLLEEEEQRVSPRPLYSPQPPSIPTSPSVSSVIGSGSGSGSSSNNFFSPPLYPHQQQPLSPPIMPYMVLSPYPSPIMDPYMYHNQIGPLRSGISPQPSYVSLPASLYHNHNNLNNDQQFQENSANEFDCVANACTKSTSVLPTLTKTRTNEKEISSSQSSSDTELSTPSKESLSKMFPTLDISEKEDDENEDQAEADVESNNEEDSTNTKKLRQKDNHHGAPCYTRRRNAKKEEKVFEENFDKMQAYQQQQQWYGQHQYQQQQQQFQQYPIYPPYYFQSPPLPSHYAGMDPYNAQQDRRTSLMSNGPISQG